MTYYATIAGVVAGLDRRNTGQARRVVYERARALLLADLNRRNPPCTKAEFERERETLEEAISRVETEASRRQQQAARFNQIAVQHARGEPSARQGEPPTKKGISAAPRRRRLNFTPSSMGVYYYDRIAGVVTKLHNNTEKTRRAVYERARVLLLTHLTRRNPPHTEAEIERERRTLEEAIRQVEAEASRRQQQAACSNQVSAQPTRRQSHAQRASANSTNMATSEVRRRRSLGLKSSSTNAYYYAAGAIADIGKTGRAVYGRALVRLLAQFNRPASPRPEAEIKRERVTLEEMIRQVEASADPGQRKAARSNGFVQGATNTLFFQTAAAEPTERPDSSAPGRELLELARPSPPARQHELPIMFEHDGRQSASSVDPDSSEQAETQRGPADTGSVHPRLQAMIQAARYQGVELDLNEFRQMSGEPVPTPVALSQWAQDAGMWSRAVRIRWRHLLRLNDSGPVVLLFTDGTAGLLTGADATQQVVYLKDPYAPVGAESVAVDELRLSQLWAGEAVLVRASREFSSADAPFNLRWLVDLVLHEKQSLRDIGLASLTISFLTIAPPLLVMMMVNKVLQFHSVSTLTLLCVMMLVVVAYETLLGHARRLVISVISARLDAKLNLHLFNRLLRLPLDYFERHPAGQTMYQTAQIYRVRDFLTGRLLTTFLDLITLCVLLPVLFYLSAILASIVLVCAGAITLIILAYLKPLRVLYARVTAAETWKSAALGETIVGIKTVKALALEPQRRALWDERIAEAGKWRLAFGKLANWPQTLVTPIQRLMVYGTILLGAYIMMNDPSGYMVGSLFAFLLLSQRVSQPLVGLARLVEDYEEVSAAIAEAGAVLNRPVESATGAVGLRPKFAGAVSFDDVTFTYTGTKVPALDRMSFSIPAGTMLGIVGRSGSGKSTVIRLLQGINRDYSGFLKIDGTDLREVDLRHLRQSLGVVLQSNFLFRGSIRDNIIAGRPGLTLTDAVHAARLAGAEEFIERMPNGYETYIEEGSPNLSGGQAQRLAIARALIHDPRILILDEATSALDPESEAVVSANLTSIARGRTMILVSHRMSSLIECDQILVMEAGKVADIAPHSVLLERCQLYSQLWTQQHRHLESSSPRHPVVAPRLITGN
jgi:ATP-binding cassette, subfamily B, bacterial HlyB/CyaB